MGLIINNFDMDYIDDIIQDTKLSKSDRKILEEASDGLGKFIMHTTGYELDYHHECYHTLYELCEKLGVDFKSFQV